MRVQAVHCKLVYFLGVTFFQNMAFFFFISIMKVYDNFPKAKHQALKNTIEMIAEEEIITLIGFQDQVQVQVAVHIVSNQGSVD